MKTVILGIFIAIFGVGTAIAGVTYATPVASNQAVISGLTLGDSNVRVVRFQDKAEGTATTTCYVATTKFQVGTNVHSYPSISCVK